MNPPPGTDKRNPPSPPEPAKQDLEAPGLTRGIAPERANRGGLPPRPDREAIRRKALEILRREMPAAEFAAYVQQAGEADTASAPGTAPDLASAPPAAATASASPAGAAGLAPSEPATPALQAGSSSPARPVRFEEPIPARMLNEFVYCPRLFYYEFVEGVFVHNADTIRGKALHKRVDQGEGGLPPATGPASKPKTRKGSGESTDETKSGDEEAPETIHSRSVQIGSQRLGVTAKIDLVEVRGPEDDLFSSREVCPVDYKAGAPRQGEEGNELWDADKMQLGLQALILRENGYVCREGIIYYRATKQRVRLPITPELEDWIEDRVEEARRVAVGPIPPPLENSPKCPRCSLVTVCLPDETRLLAARPPIELVEPTSSSKLPADAPPVRRLMAPRDDQRALYLNTQGLRVGRKGERLIIREEGKDVDEVRFNDLLHLALFGNIQISTQAIQALCEAEIPVTYFSMGGWFYGITRGHELKNVFLRIEQFRQARDPGRCLELARQFVHGKIRNHRTLLMRNHVEPPRPILARLKQFAHAAARAATMEALLGIEGSAASDYFSEFAGMIKVGGDAELPDESAASPPREAFNFHFTQRNRRPPTDPVNAMLSLAYSLLAKDCTLAALAVGFDPYVGFYHQPRFGRPALALDLMEEFRPLVAESTVLSCINNRVIQPADFVRAGQAVNLTTTGRRRFFEMYEQRMNSVLTHPVFDYKVSYRRALELQARLLARVLTGEIPHYTPLTTR